MKQTKIICTIGPATADYETMHRLLKAGMNVVRLNMSHGDEGFYRQVVRNVKRLRKQTGYPLALLWDLQGPEIRTGDVPEPYTVAKGDKICLTTRPTHETDKGVLSVSYDGFPASVRRDDTILIDNGTLKVEVVSVQGTEVRCRVLNKGSIKSRMHVNLTGKVVKLPSLSQKDLQDLKLGVKLGADWFALSFVRAPKDLKQLREQLNRLKSTAKVMAKIETPEAVKCFEKLLKVSDGVMVARGDLGSELPFDQVPQVQDDMVAFCREAGKPVVIATHMLESMLTRPTPTRAEATDIAHAVMSEADATMLSGETAVGHYPVEAVKAMAKLIRTTELTKIHEDSLIFDAQGDKEEVLLAAATLANQVEADAILVFTRSGETARLMARNRPHAPIFAFAPRQALCEQLALMWGVHPVKMSFSTAAEKTIQLALRWLRQSTALKKKAKLVVVSDSLMSRQKDINTVLLMTL